MPTPLIAGNWKMNGTWQGAAVLAGEIAARAASAGTLCEILICPPAPLLYPVAALLDASPVALGGQDCHSGDGGAHTGDVSAPMLADAGCRFVIVGHSERRADHGEGDALVQAKAMAAHRAGLTAIICVGETLAERDEGRAADVVGAQIAGSLPEDAGADNTVIAYEPVWAIGTGRTPGTQDVAEIHGHIRAGLKGRAEADDEVRILYGGSVKPENAAELLAVADVNGALVGGASLNADDFWAICQSCP